MLRIIDNFLDKITMYRIVLYVLIAYVLVAAILSGFGLLPFNPVAVLFSAFFITTVCLLLNIIFASAFKVPANAESVYITALILTLIIQPIISTHDGYFFSLAIWSSVLAMASKYILAIGRKHIFNPAAIAVVLTAFVLGQSAIWWIGTYSMMPITLIGGFLIARKIRRMDLVLSFFATATITILSGTFKTWAEMPADFFRIIAFTPLFFFATVMLTEPLTTPPTRGLRIIYGAFVGFLFSPAIHLGSIYSTPELALVVGNIFSYIVSPKGKLILRLKEVREVAHDTYDFVFRANKKISFLPGQYLEWTISDRKLDSRGNRRYFTIASSPTESDLIIGVKFYPEPSAFKKQLKEMKSEDVIIAGQRAGDFTLPPDLNRKIVFIAGGIGITPFRSMFKYLLDKREKRNIVLFYSNRTEADIAYAEILRDAYRQLKIKTIFTLTDLSSIPAGWRGKRGFVTPAMIAEEVPDFKERYFYLSGPHSMVVSFEDTLRQMGIPKTHIKKDFFPGFA